MLNKPKQPEQGTALNILTQQWLEVMALDAKAHVCSVLDALRQASTIRCIASASPLDIFAAHRFLLTLLYWKADEGGGVQQVRESLLNSCMPQPVLDAIEAELPSFRLFDSKAPFLQDTKALISKDKEPKSAGSLFAEFASGTNIAHFHHGDDENMRLCVRCATIGMLRLVPWTQSGGAGLTPSIHNAPPVVAIALGTNLATTLGLNLVPLTGAKGAPKWSGHFKPTDKDKAVPYLEALTWNSRRVGLRMPDGTKVCWRCGNTEIDAVGPIVYLKNEETKSRKDANGKTIPFVWEDPAAFYTEDAPYTAIKSSKEEMAASGHDLTRLLGRGNTPTPAVVAANLDHQTWCLVIPCTNPANNKTFDHRQLKLAGALPNAISSTLPAIAPAPSPHGLDGWLQPRRARGVGGAARFVHTAARLFTNADWCVLSNAAYREMHESPAAFDLFIGLLWSLRGKVKGLPSKNVAWLVLKLMAAVPSRARVPRADAVFCPLGLLPKRQFDERSIDGRATSIYPAAFPRGRRLEAALRAELDTNMRKRMPEHVDWTGLCYGLDQLID